MCSSDLNDQELHHIGRIHGNGKEKAHKAIESCFEVMLNRRMPKGTYWRCERAEKIRPARFSSHRQKFTWTAPSFPSLTGITTTFALNVLRKTWNSSSFCCFRPLFWCQKKGKDSAVPAVAGAGDGNAMAVCDLFGDGQAQAAAGPVLCGMIFVEPVKDIPESVKLVVL